MKSLVFSLTLFLASFAQAPAIRLAPAPEVLKPDDPAPAVVEAPLEDPELKNLEWNRYVSKNFVILSIDNQKGKELAETIEGLKSKSLSRWGFPDVTFSKECRIFAVPSYNLLKKLFNITAPRAQLRKDVNVLWVVLDDQLEKSVSPFLSQVALAEYETAQKTTLPFWFKRGAFGLSAVPADIRQELKNFEETARKEQFVHTAEQMLVGTEEEYNKQSAENKKIYDRQALCLCLLLRKEFGEVKLQGFLRILSRNKPDVSVAVVYGFKDLASFDKNYIRFMKDLTGDVTQNETPDSYLTITPVSK